LSFSLFPQIKKMVRNYPTTANFHYVGNAASPTVPFDAVTEHWFADQASFDEMMAQFASDPEKFRRLSEDEEKFCDKQHTIMFMVQEHPQEG
jgi:EthD domain